MNAILIGKGGWGELLKLYIQKNTHFNLVGVYGSDFDISQIPPYTQVAFIATPLYSHFDLTLMCIKKGLHVFVEKPTCKTLEQFHILQDHAQKHNLKIYTDYIYLCSNSILYIIEALKNKRIESIQAIITQYGRFYKDENVLEVLGVHWLSVFCKIFSDIRIKKFSYTDMHQLQAVLLGKDDTQKDCEITLFCSLVHDKKARTLQISLSDMSIFFDMQGNPTLKIFENKKSSHVHFDEQHNIAKTLEFFYEILSNSSSYKEHIKICHKVLQLCCDMRIAI